MAEADWVDVGATADWSAVPLRRISAGNRELAVSLKDGQFGAVSNACNHVGGPLGDGRLDGDYVTCPWHNSVFDMDSGERVAGPAGKTARLMFLSTRVEGDTLYYVWAE